MMPIGWNIKKEARNSQPVQSVLEKKEMIPGGWISQRKAKKEKILEASNNQQDCGSVEGPTTKP